MKIWRKIVHALKRRSRLRQLVVMAVPLQALGDSDAVAAMWSRIVGYAPRKRIVRLDRWCTHIRSVLPGSAQPAKVILVLFAHPSPQFTGFAVNRAPDSTRDVLLRGWWEDPNISFELLVAHVCSGAAILSDRAWNSVFPHWVSYDTPIYGYYDSSAAVARWNRITNATMDAGLDGGSMRNVADRIRFAYIGEMMDIDSVGDAADGDPLNFMYFQGALDAIKTSEDHV